MNKCLETEGSEEKNAGIEQTWYRDYKKYQNSLDIEKDSDLINFKLEKSAHFRYIHLKESPLRRIPNSLRRRLRRLFNHPAGRTMGLMNVKCPKAMLNLLNSLSRRVADITGQEKPYPLLVTSILRSVEHQEHLKKLGFPTTENSSHCNGYAADIEKRWLKKNRPHVAEAFDDILSELYNRGIINRVDYGDFEHICLNPEYIPYYNKKRQ